MPKKRWTDLSPRTKKVIGLAATVEGVLKVAALVDLKGRPADQVRGLKPKWALAIIVTNSAGIVPIAYLLRGRRTA